MKTDKIITDALGFPLEVIITVGDFEGGQHRCYENADTGKVEAGTPHKINIRHGLIPTMACMIAAHEAYHLFDSVRHLITCDEETEAEAFGGLVRRIFEAAL